jgi:hypothetical protein
LQIDLVYAGKQKYNNYIVDKNLEGFYGKGMQAGVVWSMVVDKLHCELNDGYYYYTVGYENSIAVLIKKKFLPTESEILTGSYSSSHLIGQICPSPPVSR